MRRRATALLAHIQTSKPSPVVRRGHRISPGRLDVLLGGDRVARKAKTAKGKANANGASSATKAPAANGAERGTVAGYFRQLFKKTPRLLGERSNQTLLEQWLADNPGHTEVPKSVKANLANLKSVLRSKKRKKTRGQARAVQAVEVPQRPAGGRAVGIQALEGLEAQIDDCLSMAKGMDREALHDVITLLRRARNQVVWKIGQ